MSYQEDRLNEIAGAIRTKKGTTGTIQATQFADQILSIPTGIDTSDATATAASIRSGHTAYAKGSKLTGTLADFTGSTAITPSASTQTMATAGKYMGSNITVNPGLSSADATATAATIRSGYTAYVNNAKVTGTLATYSGATAVTPSTSAQTLATSGKYVGGDITVNAMSTYTGATTVTPNSSTQTLATAGKYVGSNITVNPGINTTDATATAAAIRSGYTAYVNNAKVTGTMADYTGMTTVTPNSSTQTLATAGKYVGSNITVNPQTATQSTYKTYYSYSTYAANEKIYVDCTFYPKTCWGYAVLNSSSPSRMYGWSLGHQGYSTDSSATIQTKTFDPDGYRLYWTPNGTKGTAYFWIAGSSIN